MAKKPTPLTKEQVRQAAQELAQIDVGRDVLAAILTLHKAGFTKLDLVYQPLALDLIRSMTNEGGGWAGSAPIEIQNALVQRSAH
jgi:hypothetical protein